MSSKSTKKTTLTSTTTKSKTSTRSSVEPGAKEPTPIPSIMISPVSPTRLNRLQEKNELQDLNDRLVNYITSVKSLEQENAELTHRVQIVEEKETREVTSVRVNYENELEKLRVALDDANKTRAACQVENSSLVDERNQLRARFDKLEKDFKSLEALLSNRDNEVLDLKEQLNKQYSLNKKHSKDLKDLKSDKDRCDEELKKLKTEFEKEVVLRISLGDENKSLKDRIKFKEDLHHQEVMELKTTRSFVETEVEKKLQKQHEYDMAKSLKEIREQFLGEVEKAKAEYELKNKIELSNAMDRVSDYSKQSDGLKEELKSSHIKIEELITKMTYLENENSTTNAKLKDMEEKINIERKIYARRLAEKDDEIANLRNNLEKQIKEYQELMDVKLTLDFEIATYRKLLEGEESRLNISTDSTRHSASRSTPMRRTPLRGKRKRAFMSEELSSDYSTTSNCKGEIEIAEQDIEGKFIKLFNKGEKDINIGGWQLLRKADSKETTFKFHRSVVIKTGANVTVWSSECGATHTPPTTIVMKTQKWFTGDKMSSKLLNNEGEEVAEMETSRSVISSSAIHSSGSYYGASATETRNNRECSIM